ncbi:recombinase family protein [Burkholderia territorii]|uniref:recombinase family protein n=1 Tax=Burkholderia territorii TaxID=1503055 RepID=UPI0009BE718B|nr:recombinase family protein [Burkholderia territorii]
MKIGYARVSTDEQHLDLQIAALRSYGCDQIYSDKGISGACFERPGLTDALRQATEGSTLVVWRLDRLGRSLAHLITVIAQLSSDNVQFASITETIDTNTPVGRFTFHMIAALAEFERSLISERTRAGLASARQRGSRIGRPPVLGVVERQHALALLGTHTEAQVADILKIHIRTLRRSLDLAGHQETESSKPVGKRALSFSRRCSCRKPSKMSS